MGCLPGIILFLLATAGGWWLGGENGVVWGAVIGLTAGVLTTMTMLMLLRRASRRGAGRHGASDTDI